MGPYRKNSRLRVSENKVQGVLLRPKGEEVTDSEIKQGAS